MQPQHGCAAAGSTAFLSQNGNTEVDFQLLSQHSAPTINAELIFKMQRECVAGTIKWAKRKSANAVSRPTAPSRVYGTKLARSLP